MSHAVSVHAHTGWLVVTQWSITFAFDHCKVRHLHVSGGTAAAFQRSRHAVAELEIGVGNVGAERQFEVGICDSFRADCGFADESTDDVEVA